MEATESRAGGTTTLRIVGRVDSSVSKLLEQRVQDVVSRDEHIVVDLGAMNYVSSAGLRSFIMLAKHAHAQQKTIALAAMQDEVSEIFEISGLLELFTVYGTVALSSPAATRCRKFPSSSGPAQRGSICYGNTRPGVTPLSRAHSARRNVL